MKKRVLSFLLLLAMLVTMVPVMATGAAAAGDDEAVPRSEVGDPVHISDYYELYKTEGLVAFFDAIDPNNGTLDLANGKWYARVYNADTGKLEVSTTLYATVKGGVYSEENQTGWQTYENGFGYADPSYALNSNVIEFDRRALLHNLRTPAKAAYANWAVDALVRVDLRNVAGKDVNTDAFLFGSVKASHATNLQAGGKGKVTWTLLPAAGKTALDIAKDSTAFIDNNGKAESLFVAKVADGKSDVKFTVAYGDTSKTTGLVKKADYPENGAGSGFHILKNEQGAVYTIRVYGSETGEALTAQEATANATVDTLIRLGVDIDKFNLLVELGDDVVTKFLSEIAPAELADDATKEEYEAKIVETAENEKELRKVKQLNDYERLYIGADGKSIREDGGHLVALFGAQGKAVDLEKGVWINKLGDLNATFGNKGEWQVRADGGVGYTLLYGKFNELGKLVKDSPTNNVGASGGSTHLNTRLNFGLELLPDVDYTIEYVAKYMPIYVGDPDVEDKIARDPSGEPIEFYVQNKNAGISGAQYTAPLDYLGLISSWTVTRDGSYQTQMPSRGDVIWMITDKTPSWSSAVSWVGCAAFSGGGGLLASGIRDYGKVHTYVYTLDEDHYEDENGDAVVDATYSIYRDSVSYVKESLSTANLAAADLNGDGATTAEQSGKYENWGKVYYDRDDVGKFYLSSSIPTDFYTVRIYDVVLTEKELAYNAFIDMAAYAKASLSDFFGLSEDTQERVIAAMVGLGFTHDPLVFKANLERVKKLYEEQVTASDTLYVQKDLRVLTAAYEGLDTGSLQALGVSISWFNAARNGETITLKGAEWTRRANAQGAGYYILKQYAQMQTAASRQFGIYLAPEMLPDGDYTIEMVVNPTGIIEYKEDGSYERYIDRSTTYGIHYENGFMIGPLRCLIFPSASDGGSQRAALEKRWCYDQGNECWNNTSTRNHKATESAWRLTGLNDIVSYNIDYAYNYLTGRGEYVIYSDQEKAASISIKAEELLTNDQANNAFQLMVGMPCGVFSVRVYERVLSEAEKLQNHAADIIYHYNLDTTLLDKVMPIFKDDPTVIYRGLSDLSFDMPREEAQRIFDARLSALWLSFDGVAVRNDYTDGLRYYFTLDENTATAMVAAGYQIEVGAIANIAQETMPTLEGRNYDYRIKAYDGVAGRNTGFFIDEDTFAITVKAGSDHKDAMLSKVNLLGYIRLLSPSGEEMIFYVDTPYSDFTPDSFFSIYNYMMEREDIIKDASLIDHLNMVAEGCYEREYIHVMAGAAAGGNGTSEAPYNDFATAFAAAKKRLLEINVPTYLYVHAAEGIYEVHELLTLEGSEIPYVHARFVISSADGKGTLTSTRKLSNSDFIEAENNIWVYQFGADASGNYPNIRYIYVNGKIADIAHNGANSFLIADETRYMTGFYRWDIGPWLNAKAEWEAGRLTPTTLFYPLNKVDLNTRFAHYRDQYLVYSEVKLLPVNGLLPNTKSTAVNASSYYQSLFETTKFNRIAYKEISDLYYGDGAEDLAKTAGLLKLYKSVHVADTILATEINALADATAAYDAIVLQYTSETEVFNAALDAYNTATATFAEATAVYDAALAVYEQKMAELTDTESPEYLEAVAVFEAAELTYEAAEGAYESEKTAYADAEAAYADIRAAIAEKKSAKDAADAALQAEKAYFTAYEKTLDAIKTKVATLLAKGTALSTALADYALVDPTNKYPKSTEINDLKDNYPWPAAPSTGMYNAVKSLHDRGVLSHSDTVGIGDKNIAQELQFHYYRDAFLALDDLNLLKDEELNFSLVAPDSEGSAQYKSLFKQFLYRRMAVLELAKAAEDAAIKAAVGNAIVSPRLGPVADRPTSYTGAPADYVKIYNEIRDAQVLYTADSFCDFSRHLPSVSEEDAPYEGKVPYSTTLSQYKIYLNIGLVGDQSFAMNEGRAKLASTAQKIIDTAKAKYQAAYNKMVSAQKKYEQYLDAGLTNEAKAANEVLIGARAEAKKAYTDYLAQCEHASRYTTDEYDEGYILDGSGIQIAMPTEWTYNVVNLTGVDYDDYIMKDGVKHVAMYYDPNNPMSIHTESHVYNRMASLMSSHAYLDKNNEYYYNPSTGTLYYHNTEGIDGLTFEYPTMNNMFVLNEVRNLYFEDIAFTGLDYNTMNNGFTGGQASSDGNTNCLGERDVMPSGAALYGKMIRGLTVRNCNFHDLGCEAISFRERVENTLIESNTFTQIGSGAIRFGGGTATSAVWSLSQGTENCTITNNYLDGIALYIYCSPAITTQFSKDLECSYNTILNCSYSGYSIGWSWSWASFMYGEQVKLMHVDIHHNYIASFMQQMGDGGAIYTLGGNAVKEEHTLFNWCHDNYLMMTNTTGDGEGRFAAANYHDGSSSNWETYNTVVAAYSYGAAYKDDSYGHTSAEHEEMDESRFETIDTEFTMKEYVRRIRNNYNRYWAYYEQTLDSAQAFNITLRDNFLINVRSTKSGTKRGTMFYEAYRTGVTAEDFIFVENMTYVKDPGRIPRKAEDIIYDAGCDWAKADPYDLADNNY